jgi:hypothetical protein
MILPEAHAGSERVRDYGCSNGVWWGVASPPTRRGHKADRGDLPLKGGGQNQKQRSFLLTSPLEGEVAELEASSAGGG